MPWMKHKTDMMQSRSYMSTLNDLLFISTVILQSSQSLKQSRTAWRIFVMTQNENSKGPSSTWSIYDNSQ